MAVTGCVTVLPWLRPGWHAATWMVLLAGGGAALLSGARPAGLATGGAAGLLAGLGARVAAGVPRGRSRR